MIPKNETRSLKRRALQHAHSSFDKKLLKLVREYYRLSHAVWNAPLVKLEHPYQRGWIRNFQLTEKASRRKDARQLKKILSYVNVQQFCQNKQFLVWSHHQQIYVPMKHRTLKWSARELLAAKVPPDILKYFHVSKHRRAQSQSYLRYLIAIHWNGQFKIDCSHHFEAVINPYFITHQRVDMPDLKSRVDELDSFLTACDGWSRLRGYRIGRWKRDPRYRKRERVADREIQGALLESKISSTELTQKGTNKIVPFLFRKSDGSQAAFLSLPSTWRKILTEFAFNLLDQRQAGL